MSELTLVVLSFGFLALMWIFVFVVVYAMRSDLFGHRVRRMREPGAGVPASSTAIPGAASASPVPVGIPVAAAAGAAKGEPVFTPLDGSSAAKNPRATLTNASRLVITSGVKSGTEIALGTEPLTIGRSSDSSVVIRDDYTSTHHARLMVWGEDWMIQDLDSTNGTFLDGARVTTPTAVPLNTPIKIGATSFELRR